MKTTYKTIVREPLVNAFEILVNYVLGLANVFGTKRNLGIVCK